MALWVAVSTNVDISDDESGMAKDILPWIEVTKQRHKTGRFAVQESVIVQKLHRSDMYVVAISCFHSTLSLKT